MLQVPAFAEHMLPSLRLVWLDGGRRQRRGGEEVCDEAEC